MYRKLLPYCVFLICMTVTAAAWHFSSRFIREQAEKRFILRTDQITDQLIERMYTNRTILRGAAALFNASEEVTRWNWPVYIKSLRIREHYSGIQSVGFAKVIQFSELQAHIADVRADGFPD